MNENPGEVKFISFVNTSISCPITIKGRVVFSLQKRSSIDSSLILDPVDSTIYLEGLESYGLPPIEATNTSLTLVNCNFWGDWAFNFTADVSGFISIQNSTFSVPVMISSDVGSASPDLFTVVVEDSILHRSIQLFGVSWTATVRNNQISVSSQNLYLFAIPGTKNKVLAQYKPNAIFSATCDGKLHLFDNRFLNGTLFFTIPFRESTRIWCPSVKVPYSYFNVSNNQFQPISPNLEMGSYGEFKHGQRQLPAVAVTGPYSPFLPNNYHYPQQLNMARNWWGDESGPSLCCHASGKGGFPTAFVDASFWCTDPMCKTTSNQEININCVRHGCKQPWLPGYLGVISLFSVIAFLVNTFAIVYAFVQQRRLLAPQKIAFIDTEEVLVRSSKLFLMGLIASSVGCISATIVMALCINMNSKTVLRPLQQVIFPITYLFSWAVSFLSLPQIVFNVVLIILVRIRKAHHNKLRIALKIFWFWNALSVCLWAILFLKWIPSLYHSNQQMTTDSPRSQGQYMWILDSPHSYLLFVGFLAYLISVLSAMIPGRIMHNHVCHPEYAKMTNTLEMSLLSEIVKIPKVDRFAAISKIVSIIGLAVGVVNLGLQATAFIEPTIYYVGGDLLKRALTPVGLYRLQFGLAGAFSIVGIAAFSTSLWTIRAVRQAGAYTIITLPMLVAVIGTAESWQKYVPILFFPDQNENGNRVWAIVNVLSTFSWFVLLLVNYFLMRTIRRATLKELPKHARDGINSHLDDAWYRNGSNHGSVDDYSGLALGAPHLDTDSDAEAPLLGSTNNSLQH
jgi:hypothetical protein